MTESLIASLGPGEWLDDNVINFYVGLLNERSKANEKLPKIYCTDTFFYEYLIAPDRYARRYTKIDNMSEKDMIVIPVHVDKTHWCLSIVHMKNKTIQYYDSYEGKQHYDALGDKILLQLVNYLKGREVYTEDWSSQRVRNIPQQSNKCDCGVFCCMYAEFITRNQQPVFKEKQMPEFRKRMIREIRAGKLLNETQ